MGQDLAFARATGSRSGPNHECHELAASRRGWATPPAIEGAAFGGLFAGLLNGSSTPTPQGTAFSGLQPTATSFGGGGGLPSATATRTPYGAPTSTRTATPAATLPGASNTPAPATNTSVPPPSNTPAPATNTSVPPPTNTSVPPTSVLRRRRWMRALSARANPTPFSQPVRPNLRGCYASGTPIASDKPGRSGPLSLHAWGQVHSRKPGSPTSDIIRDGLRAARRHSPSRSCPSGACVKLLRE